MDRAEHDDREPTQWLPRVDADGEDGEDERAADGGPRRVRAAVALGAVTAVLAGSALAVAATWPRPAPSPLAITTAQGGSTPAAPGQSPPPSAPGTPAATSATPSSIAPSLVAAASPASRPSATTATPSTPAAPPCLPGPSTSTTAYLPNPLAAWGAGTTVLDGDGHHLGTATGVTWSSACGPGTYGVFDGADSAITTDGPLLATGPGAGFTVSAWVRLTADRGFATAVSQDGAVDSGFYLQYSSADDRWAFSRVLADLPGAPGVRALSSAPPELGAWTHLVGVDDAHDGRLLLYVDGALEGTATDVTPFAAGGPLAIGRAKYDGADGDWFSGDIRDVEVYGQTLSGGQVEGLS